MSQGLRGGQPGGPICWCGAREPGPYPAALTLLSSGSEMVLAALGQEGAWTPVMKDQPKKNQASGSIGAQQEEGVGCSWGHAERAVLPPDLLSAQPHTQGQAGP